jgi:formylglycine-generating enzyme required for sulfatase activity
VWDDANAFCEWLTMTESDGGKLPKGNKYRLPTDEEWSRAVGLATEAGATPKERHRKNTVDFPWGTGFPPKAKVGNYADSAFHEKFAKEMKWTEGYTDGYAAAAPVGSFAPNKYGIYDLGGNVWEWCEDLWEPGGTGHLFRGASWENSDRLSLLSSHRVQAGGGVHIYRSSVGFRCVMGASAR